jgi:hypothetical protein
MFIIIPLFHHSNIPIFHYSGFRNSNNSTNRNTSPPQHRSTAELNGSTLLTALSLSKGTEHFCSPLTTMMR